MIHVPRVVLAILIVLTALPTTVRADAESDETALRKRVRETNLTLAVEDESFGDVVKLLRLQTGFNIVIDPRIAMDVSDSPVTGLFVEDLPASTVLDLLSSAAGEEAVWTVMGSTIVFTIREFARSALVVRVYPLAALVAGRTPFVRERFGLLGSGKGDEEEYDEDDEPEPRYPLGTIDELVEIIKQSVSPAFWEETEGADIRTWDEARLVVRASPAIHAAIERFLEHLDELAHETFLIELLAVQTTAALQRDRATLPDADVRALLSGRTPYRALRLAVRENIASTAGAGQRRAYVADYDARFAGSRATLDPRVSSLDTGMEAWVRVVPGAPDGRFLLHLDVALAEPTPPRTHGKRDPLSLPGRLVVRRDVTTLIEAGRWTWLEGSTGGSENPGWLFLVRATPVAVPPATAATAATADAPFVPARSKVGQAAHPLSAVRIGSVEWEQATLDQLAIFLRATTGYNVYITPRVRAEVFEDVEVSLRLEDVSAKTILDLVTAPYGLAWNLTNRLITIHLDEPRYRPMVLKYFDVSDLAARLVPARVSGSAASDATRRGNPIYPVEELVELILEAVGGADAWEYPAAIEIRSGMLLVRNTPSVLETMELFLARLRSSQALVTTTVDHVRMDAEVARRLLVDAAGRYRLFLDKEALAAIDAAILEGAATRIGSERVVSLEGAGLPTWTGREQAYVGDVHVRVGGEGATAAAVAPVRVIKTLRTGMDTRLRALASYPADATYVEIAALRTDLMSMPSVTTRVGAIELPLTRTWGARTGLSVPRGATAALFATDRGEKWDVLLVTPTRARLDAE